MFSRLLNWIGWESDHLPTAEARRPGPARSATAQLLSKRPASGAAQKTPKAATSQADFNPYNTGKFDRSASWERISKNQR